MYKQAAALWDVRNVENIGPVVKLLIESLAAEIFRLSGDMSTMENRLLEKLASALTPHISLIARPAHAIATAHPFAPQATLHTTDKLIYRNPKVSNKQRLRSCAFTPLSDTTVINAKAKYMINAREFRSMISDDEWDTVARISVKAPAMNRKIWFGIQFGSTISKIDNLPLYIDIPFVSDKNSFLQQLPYCQCEFGGIPVAVTRGSIGNKSGNVIDKYDIDRMVTNEITGKYEPHFITLHPSGLIIKELSRSKVPDEVASLLPADFIEGCDDDTVWVSLEFPPIFSPEVLSQIDIRINTFVVLNKYPMKVSRVADSVSMVIPLEKSDLEYFISVESVTDNNGQTLEEIAVTGDLAREAIGDYTVRRGGCERFNTVEAKDQISRLTGLLYDESIAFTSSQKDEIKDKISQIQKLIGALEEFNEELPGGLEVTSYVITGYAGAENTILTVNYYLTNGEFANAIRSGEILECSTNSDIEEESVRLLSSTRGGKASPSATRRMDIYRYLLLSHGSIYSKEDIRNFCMANYGDYIDAVDVKLGYDVSKEPKEGIIRTLDVHISPAATIATLDKEEFVKDIYEELKRFSPQTYNYRIIYSQK